MRARNSERKTAKPAGGRQAKVEQVDVCTGHIQRFLEALEVEDEDEVEVEDEDVEMDFDELLDSMDAEDGDAADES